MNPAGVQQPKPHQHQRVNAAAVGSLTLSSRLRRLRFLSERQSVELRVMGLFMRSLSACRSVEAMQRQRYQDLIQASLVPIAPAKPSPKAVRHVMSEERRADHTLYRCSCGCWSKIVNGHGMHQWRRARQSFDAHVPLDARGRA